MSGVGYFVIGMWAGATITIVALVLLMGGDR